MLELVLSWPRRLKNIIAVFIDSVCLIFAFWFAQSVRFETLYTTTDPKVYGAVALTVVLSILLFRQLNLYRAITRYVGPQVLLIIGAGVLASTLVLFASRFLFSAPVPIASIIIYALFSLVLVGGSRLAFRLRYERRHNRNKERVIIYGAGASGRQLAMSLFNGAEYMPFCFVDDDESLHKSLIQGLVVHAPSQLPELVRENGVAAILLAMPSASPGQRRHVLNVLEDLPVQVRTIPGMADLVSGAMTIDQLENVEVEDLLGRDPVAPRQDLLDKDIRGKSVLVSGAGGSIGSELCRQIVRLAPKRLVLMELSEFALYSIERDILQILAEANIENVQVVPAIGAVQREEYAERLMREHRIETVYHAAAYKHVPLVESNVIEGVYNNVLGTYHFSRAAINAKVRKFVLISTDKAVRPTNVMGASKRVAELVLQGLAKHQETTRFCMVRFGNVLGSSGSVVPHFREQIANGGPVTVTDTEITRYFMTIPEAALLVIQAGAMSQPGAAESELSGGEVYVLDMGEPVKIMDLARKMIHLMGKRVKNGENTEDPEAIGIEITGLRPGEKLYEELLIGENTYETEHPRIMKAKEQSLTWPKIEALLNDLKQFCDNGNTEHVFELLLRAPLDFQPNPEIQDAIKRARA